MLYWIIVTLSFSIFFAALAAAIRFKKIDPAYYPFIFCTWLASVNEVASFLLSYNHKSNVHTNNVYVLAEVLLITWQFKRWGYAFKKTLVYGLVILLIVVAWIFETASAADSFGLHFYYRLCYAVMIVAISLNINKRLVTSHKQTLLKSPVFLICTGYIIFFIFKILTDAFWLYKIKSSDAFLYALYFIMAAVNCFVNLLFLIAVLWIPRKPHYISL